MTCPNCEAILGEGTSPCPNCGAVLAPESDEQAKKKTNKMRIIIAISALAVVVVALGVMLVSNIAVSAKGLRLTDTLSESLGRSVAVAEQNAGVTLLTMSEFPIFNPLDKGIYLCEDSKAVKIDGVRYPSWVIGVRTDDSGKLATVRYVNYNLLKNNRKGEKSDGFIKAANYTVGMKQKEVERTLKLLPFAIEHDNNDVSSYVYNYFYLDDNDNEIGCNLTVRYDIAKTVIDVEGGVIDVGIPVFD